MNKQSILLIGNGPSAIQNEMGNIIDQHPLVCRFNWFQIVGYEKFVGTKCDIWVTCLEEKEIIQHCQLFKKIYFPLTEERYIGMTKKIPNSECFSPQISEIASYINGNFFYPSSGLLATTYFLDLEYEIILYGFDFFQGEKHHYCDNQPRGNHHSPEMEFLAFKKLYIENKIKFLNNNYDPFNKN